MMSWLAKGYVNALNIIHYMHDKYAYERIQMALHDSCLLYTSLFMVQVLLYLRMLQLL